MYKGSILFDKEHNLEVNFSEDEKNITNLADGTVYPVGGGGGDDYIEITVTAPGENYELTVGKFTAPMAADSRLIANYVVASGEDLVNKLYLQPADGAAYWTQASDIASITGDYTEIGPGYQINGDCEITLAE